MITKKFEAITCDKTYREINKTTEISSTSDLIMKTAVWVTQCLKYNFNTAYSKMAL